MSKVFAALAVLFVPALSHAVGWGNLRQITNTAAVDDLSPAIADWLPQAVIWTSDQAANGYDSLYWNGAQIQDLTPVGGNQFLTNADGRYGVWIDDQNFNQVNVVLYDLQQGAGFPINVNPVSGTEPHVFNDWANNPNDVTVVYVEMGLPAKLIFVKNFLDVRILATGGTIHQPRVHGDWVVWSQIPSGETRSHIFCYRISTGVVTRMTNAAVDDDYPDVDGNLVVFRRSAGAIYSLPASSAAPLRKLSSNAVGERGWPRIDAPNHNVVWAGKQGGDWDLYYSDTTPGSEVLLYGGAGDQFLPDIEGDEVAFSDRGLAGIGDIYQLTIVH